MAAALAALALLGIRLLPTADLALYAASSACVAWARIEVPRRGAWLTWLAAAGVGVLLTGWETAVPFALFFGPFPLIKAAVESRVSVPLRALALKLLAADLLLALLAALYLSLFVDPLSLPLPWWALALLAQPVLLLYDYALTAMITLYVARRRPHS